MKIQDAIFWAIFTSMAVLKKPQWYGYAGIISLIVAIPLFAKWVFFTAERLTWYGAVFLFCAVIYNSFLERN